MKFKMKKKWSLKWKKKGVWNEKNWSLEKQKTKKKWKKMKNKWKINEKKNDWKTKWKKHEVTNENPNEK